MFYYIFKISVWTFTIFFILEIFRPGLITNYLNLNLILIIVVISGIVAVLLNDYEKHI